MADGEQFSLLQRGESIPASVPPSACILPHVHAKRNQGSFALCTGEPNLQLRFGRSRQCGTHAVFVVDFVAIVVDVTVTFDVRGIVIVITGRAEPPVKVLSTLSLANHYTGLLCCIKV